MILRPSFAPVNSHPSQAKVSVPYHLAQLIPHPTLGQHTHKMSADWGAPIYTRTSKASEYVYNLTSTELLGLGIAIPLRWPNSPRLEPCLVLMHARIKPRSFIITLGLLFRVPKLPRQFSLLELTNSCTGMVYNILLGQVGHGLVE